MKQYQDVWITSGPLWLPIEEPSKEEENTTPSDRVADEPSKEEENTTPSDRVADKPSGDADNANTVTKKTRKVRPPRPAARQISYPVIGPNQVSVPTHLYKVGKKITSLFFNHLRLLWCLIPPWWVLN